MRPCVEGLEARTALTGVSALVAPVAEGPPAPALVGPGLGFWAAGAEVPGDPCDAIRQQHKDKVAAIEEAHQETVELINDALRAANAASMVKARAEAEPGPGPGYETRVDALYKVAEAVNKQDHTDAIALEDADNLQRVTAEQARYVALLRPCLLGDD